jgi:hypothetical protein
MKTLDEVIMCLEGCGHIDCDDCPYHYEDEKIEVDDCAQTYKDALHYLKKYRDNYKARNDQIERYQKAAKDCEEILTDYVALKQYWAEQQANHALSWDELRAMEGKPVWVEYNRHLSEKAQALSKGWFVIFDFRPLGETEMMSMTNNFVFTLFEQQRDLWQAYRKERS